MIACVALLVAATAYAGWTAAVEDDGVWQWLTAGVFYTALLIALWAAVLAVVRRRRRS